MEQFNMLTAWAIKVPQRKPCGIKIEKYYNFLYSSLFPL